MRKIISLTVVLGVMALAAAPAQAAKYNLDSTVVLNTIGATGTPPISGSGQDYAGSIKGALARARFSATTTSRLQGSSRAPSAPSTTRARYGHPVGQRRPCTRWRHQLHRLRSNHQGHRQVQRCEGQVHLHGEFTPQLNHHDLRV